MTARRLETDMTRDDVQRWLDRYVEAWKTYDRTTIADLFGPDATYRYHPYDEGDSVVHGREAIVRDWIEPEGDSSSRDEPGTYDAHYEPYAIDGNRAVAVCSARTIPSNRRSQGIPACSRRPGLRPAWTSAGTSRTTADRL